MFNKTSIKRFLGELPLTAEIYWQLAGRDQPLSKSASLRRTEEALPGWVSQAQAAARTAPEGKKILCFATLRYWIEYSSLLSVALSGLGHHVTLAFLPYANWWTDLDRFDLRRQNAYMRWALSKAEPALSVVSLLDVKPVDKLPQALQAAIEENSLRDAQYTLQVEEIDIDRPETESGKLYAMRLGRNLETARLAFAWIQANRPDLLITPNGSILEMGVVYQVARYLGIPTVTYEFGEQRSRIWLAKDTEVMRQETDGLWQVRKDEPLSTEELQQVHELFASRQSASLWENFARRWQGQPSQGGQQARQALGLDAPGPDARPVVLLAANVIGDSLTLGRQLFTDSMTEWLEHTVRYFARHSDYQLVVRIHPGERHTKGPSVADVVRRTLPGVESDQALAHIHLVAAEDPINTYDLVEIADLGLVYTTTVGMEMAMSGAPVIVVGQTHYRDKGFTLDPDSWEAFFQITEKVLADPAGHRLSRPQVDAVWNYAYRFFFEYPCPFPWHLLDFWERLDEWTVERVLSPEGRQQFGGTFDLLAGQERKWTP